MKNYKQEVCPMMLMAPMPDCFGFVNDAQNKQKQ